MLREERKEKREDKKIWKDDEQKEEKNLGRFICVLKFD